MSSFTRALTCLLYLVQSLLLVTHFDVTRAVPAELPALNETLKPTVRQRPRPFPFPRRCGEMCRFTLCTADPSPVPISDPDLILGPPRMAFDRVICSADSSTPVQTVSTGSPEIEDNGVFIGLHRWKPSGSPRLSRPFVNRFFRAQPLMPGSRSLLGIAHGRPLGNQWSFLHDRCIKIPLDGFTILDNGKPIRVRGGGRGDCVAFRTVAPTLQVLLVWEGNGDGDLALQEPTLEVVDFLTDESSGGGRLNGDIGGNLCNATGFPGYVERITYLPGDNVPSGPFVAEAWQASDCGRNNSSTDWSLLAVMEGSVMPIPQTTSTGTVMSTVNYTRAGDLVFAF